VASERFTTERLESAQGRSLPKEAFGPKRKSQFATGPASLPLHRDRPWFPNVDHKRAAPCGTATGSEERIAVVAFLLQVLW